MKGFDAMNNNKVFETDKICIQHLYTSMKPKNATNKCRVAKVGAGVVILPDNGNPITEKEIVKALGLKNVEPEAEKEERTNFILEHDCDYEYSYSYYLSLTDSQIRLLEFLYHEDILSDWSYKNAGKMKFEEI